MKYRSVRGLRALRDLPRDSEMDYARRRMYERAAGKHGATCPCCDRFIKVYRRSFTADMARCLILLEREGRDWVDIKRLPVRGGDYAKAVHWGVVETQGENSGLWRITEMGVGFIGGRVRLPAHVFLLKNVCVEVDDVQIGIRDALRTKFDFEALMNGHL